ncbi:MAG: FAD-dependent oxidoreductase [Polyangiaceae bacterium]|nr:FAD-dependent oxidoreductase [Polyangiaceae bacterium]
MENQDTKTCWQTPAPPSSELLALLKQGPLASRSHEASSVAKAILAYRRDEVGKPTILVGTGTCGLGAGAGKTIEAIQGYLARRGVDADVVQVGCVGLCSDEPIVDVQLPGKARVSFCRVTADQVEALLDSVFEGEIPRSLLLGQYRHASHAPWPEVPFIGDHAFFRPQLRWVLANSGLLDPSSIEEYIARGGYSALERVLRLSTPDEICQTVLDSGLRGRGGGGFPAGLKWKLARQSVADRKYLICNADEGDPGAFMDRAVCESDPHRLLEGMVIAAYAIGANKAYIYIRAEYPLAVKRLEEAMEKAEAYGLLGRDILGSGFDLDIVIKMGAGAFVCGEETALIHSIEGKRGMPRPRPPFPAAKGAFGKPTIINNVETLANVPGVVALGAVGFAAVGTEKSKGTKVFALSGMVNRTGLVEIPMGTTIREIVAGIGGGVPGNKRCKAVQMGGPSGGCIPEPQLDVPIDYDSLKQLGAIMGSGGMVVLDQSTCMVDLAKYFMEFIQSESCGKCIPCREGTRRLLEILQALTRARGRESDVDALLRFQGVMYLEQLAGVIKATSLCGLGQTAPNPVLSTLRWFRDEYEAHIFERSCPAGTCKDLVGAPCQTGCPVGTEVWRYVAHIDRGEYPQAYQVIREANPFPSICARVCNHPCETVCRCGTTGGDPIAIRTLKRFVVDHVAPETYHAEVKPAGANAKRVAVIGAGPAGLTAAHYLSLRGHRVTLFERESVPGGMLVAGIPTYRLPRALIEKEIQQLMNENVELRCGVALGRDFTFEDLVERQGFDAVYLSIGAHRSLTLGLPGQDLPGVMAGMEFLRAHNLRNESLARGRVGVVGGGNSAMDAARVALRQPGVESVTVLYRRTRDEMPAFAAEIDEALEEGVALETLVAPVSVVASGGKLSGLRLLRNRLGEPDASGRRKPIPIDGSEFEVPLDTLIVAISEQPETDVFSGLGTNRSGALVVNRESFVTGRAGVFAGGDVTRGPSTVIEAIADGKQAAAMIDHHLTGKQLKTFKKIRLPSVFVEPLAGDDDDQETIKPRVAEPLVPADKRRSNFDEAALCISESAARGEAHRCLRCDLEFTRPQ